MIDKESFYDIDNGSTKKEPVKATTPFIKNTQGDDIMADVDTQMLSGQHSDIRREQAEQTSNIRREAAEHRATMTQENMKGFDRVNADVLRGTAETIKEGLKESFNIRGDVKDSRYDVNSRITNATDRVVDRVEDSKDSIVDRLFTIGRESADNRAQITALGYQVRDGFVAASKDMEINALKGQVELAKQTTYLSDKIDGQAEKTRELINDLKYHDLNRGLVERNAALVEAEGDRRYWRHHADQAQFQGQWAALQSQIQAFASQLQETRQGMVNFGTMAGVGQTSTSNNVR